MRILFVFMCWRQVIWASNGLEWCTAAACFFAFSLTTLFLILIHVNKKIKHSNYLASYCICIHPTLVRWTEYFNLTTDGWNINRTFFSTERFQEYNSKSYVWSVNDLLFVKYWVSYLNPWLICRNSKIKKLEVCSSI